MASKDAQKEARHKRPLAHQFSVTSIAWYPADRGIFASSSHDAKVKVWDTAALTAASVIDLGSKVFYASFGKCVVNYDLIAGSRFFLFFIS